MKHWKCKQCIYGTTYTRQVDIENQLPDGVICYIEDKAQIIKDDDNECKFYCCEAM